MRSIAGFVVLFGVASLSTAVPAQSNITSDAYFYGQSPPVYPSPEGSGTGSWASAYEKAKKLVAQLTPEEKVNLTAGVSANNGCSGNIAPIPRLNFPGFCVSDAGNGLRGTDYVNAWSSGIHDGARVVEGGRNWEGYSTDPYLSGALVYETVRGMQSAGVAASTKHYILNEQETYRNPQKLDDRNVAALSSNVDDKTMHELYLWPFADAVRAGTASIMCSYQRINNSYGCQNSKTLNGLLKTELGFQGWHSLVAKRCHAGIAAANAGLDMVMPQTQLWGSNLTKAIANGTMKASRLDDMATRILATWYQLNQDTDFPGSGVGMPKDLNEAHQAVIGKSADSKNVLLQSAIEGHVLVKNTNNALPLRSPKLVSVFGYDAKAPDTLQLDLGFKSFSPAIQENHTFAPLDALQEQAYQTGASILWDTASQDPDVNPTTEACLVFINSYATEGYDRPGLVHELSDALVTNVANKCDNTVVIIHNAGIRLVNAWIDHPNVTAVLFAHLPGQDSGRSVVDLLYGRANPSGKLPYTVAKNTEDYGKLLHPTQAREPYGLFPQDDFVEGVYIDYRAFDRQGIDPQFEFGFGLSYTSYEYSGLSVDTTTTDISPYPHSATIQEGGNPHLWDEVVAVSAEVKNTGKRDGDEVAQLYVGIPDGPVRQLRGFEKVHVSAGSTVKVDFSLTRRDLSTWDVQAQQWRLQTGTYNVFVGRSSRDLPLQTQFTI
ncbi:hypothetical protein N8T08_001734 [Aspergillus melleus]|uniref:Uncharacterized protein n=1 Tax=Aspergillus melleus TaxID=138277 RepID=A0ACC3ANE2_9EURO|nr:hypothetical protein N8T08_001734 [Aspergillus melleus]